MWSYCPSIQLSSVVARFFYGLRDRNHQPTPAVHPLGLPWPEWYSYSAGRPPPSSSTFSTRCHHPRGRNNMSPSSRTQLNAQFESIAVCVGADARSTRISNPGAASAPTLGFLRMRKSSREMLRGKRMSSRAVRPSEREGGSRRKCFPCTAGSEDARRWYRLSYGSRCSGLTCQLAIEQSIREV